jgi:hypothetical protein
MMRYRARARADRSTGRGGESGGMTSTLPDGLSVKRNQELDGRARHPWYRRVLLCLVAVLPVLALLNVFGQKPTLSVARAAAADLEVTAPARLRSGLIFQVRVRVTAHRTIDKPQLVFDPGWWESMSLNSLVPNPSNQTNANGRVVMSFNQLAAGHTMFVWLYFQVNPTNVGKRREDVELDDGTAPITTVHRSLTIFP